eukprot:TRINITY_DN7937_c0_g1_i1.p1 TRINITY_DN7937_c0_g1~~TRINITY_DN7937_c0_g1_i1.p1  ORF type:complete len:101 (+),score=29.64 TRINITY_DN7937_c0_g1_i1:1-303(+)
MEGELKRRGKEKEGELRENINEDKEKYKKKDRDVVVEKHSLKYEVARLVMIFVLFVFLQNLFNKYVLDPYFRPQMDYTEDQLIQMATSRSCPPGMACDFQ